MLFLGGYKKKSTATQKLNDGAKVLLLGEKDLLQTFYRTFYSNIKTILIIRV